LISPCSGSIMRPVPVSIIWKNGGIAPYRISGRRFQEIKKFDPIKTGIVSVLGNIQTPAAFELLLGLLRHESPHIVNWAGNALGKFENVEALPAMEAASERIGGEQMIEAAIRRLRDLEKPTSPAAA
jgi:hypothetical protein